MLYLCCPINRNQQKRRSLLCSLNGEKKTLLDYARLQQLPGFGAVRAATLLALVGTPQRFRTKRQFWPYCGFAVVTQARTDLEFGSQVALRNMTPPQTT